MMIFSVKYNYFFSALNQKINLTSIKIKLAFIPTPKRVISKLNFLQLIDTSLPTLEIGPWDKPSLKGHDVFYFDIMSQNEIKKSIEDADLFIDANSIKFKADASNVPFINFIDSTGDMSKINKKFNNIYSSHNIEHQICLITHLQQLSSLLNNQGKIYLIIPDKRYCFDHFIAESSLADIIEQYYEPATKYHPLRSILSMKCETTHNNSTAHWLGWHQQTEGIEPSCYKKALEYYQANKNSYINVHRWRFTPENFKTIIETLNKIDLISLEIEQIYETNKQSIEFMVILKNKESKLM